MEAKLSQPTQPIRSAANGKVPAPESGGEGHGDFLLASHCVEAVREGAHAKASLGPGEIVEIIELPGNDKCFECARAYSRHSTARVPSHMSIDRTCPWSLVARGQPSANQWPQLLSQPRPRRSLGP